MVTIIVNGVRRDIQAPDDTPLLYVLRNELELSGPQFGCGLAQCGACSVLLEGKEVRSCIDVYKSLRRETVFHGERAGFAQDEYAFNTFGAHFAEVEVDLETGQVRVLRHVAAHDSGRIINKQTAESQVFGAITQGLSAGLFEERVMDSTTGRPTNTNLRDYKIATSLDIPEVSVEFVDVVDEKLNNLGTKGLGEPPRIPSSAAIANAVFNAIGVHVREIPMTPQRVLAALKQKEA